MIAVLISSYLIGSVLFADIVGRVYRVSLHDVGSGNPGARNAGRMLGKTAFIIVALGDGFKGLLTVWGAYAYDGVTAASLATIAVTLGHCFSLFHRLKGGKGVATLVGITLFWAQWDAIYALLLFVILVLIVRSASKAGAVVIVLIACYFTAVKAAPIVLSYWLVTIVVIGCHLFKQDLQSEGVKT